MREFFVRILKNERAEPEIMVRFYITVVMALLLYGAESWTVSKFNMNRLNSFHNRAVRYLTRSHIRMLDDGRWEYPDHKKLRDKCKVEEMSTYIGRRRKTLRTFLEKERPKLWEEMQNTRAPARDVKKILWWEQPVPVESE